MITTIIYVITEIKEKGNVIKSAQGPPHHHLSENNLFFSKFLFSRFGTENKAILFSASSSSQLHSEREDRIPGFVWVDV
ncbi:hypothetical protein ACSQ67_014338 [Phaseolus vulgaris]